VLVPVGLLPGIKMMTWTLFVRVITVTPT
jgi:hypothetical protein